jgi:hypothetical protein
MSIPAAQEFVRAVKVTRSDFARQDDVFYQKFIRQKQTPTANDIKELAELIEKMEEVAKVYHDDVANAIKGFGGPSDNIIDPAKIMLKTLKKKMKK